MSTSSRNSPFYQLSNTNGRGQLDLWYGCVRLAGNTLPRISRIATNAVMTMLATIPDPITIQWLAADTGVSDQLVAGGEGGILGDRARTRG